MRMNLLAGVLMLAIPAAAQAAGDKSTEAQIAAQTNENRAATMIPPAPMGLYFSRRLMPQMAQPMGSNMGPNMGPNGPSVGGFPPVGFDPIANARPRTDDAGKGQTRQDAAPTAPAPMAGYPGNGMGSHGNTNGAADTDARMSGRFNMGGRNGWGGNDAFANGMPYGRPYGSPYGGMPYGTPFNGQPQGFNAPQTAPTENAPQTSAQPQGQTDAPQAAPNMQPPAEPEWVAQRRAEAEKYRAEAQKRYAEAEKYRIEMQKRFAEEARKRAAAYAGQGYGAPYGAPVRPGYGQGYGAPYGVPYGYAPQPQNRAAN